MIRTSSELRNTGTFKFPAVSRGPMNIQILIRANLWRILGMSLPNSLRGVQTFCYGFTKSNTKVQEDMKSDHIETRRLYEAVTEKAVLEQFEVEHLQTCEECLELVRVFVRQHIQKSRSR